MRHASRLAATLLLALAWTLGAEEPVPGTVLADTLNVRAAPGRNAEVVARLGRGAAVSVVKRQEEWLGIVAPEQAEAWLPTKVVAQGVVTEAETPLYSGPGIYFTRYGTLAKGTAVKTLETRDGVWLRVVPPAGTIAWVHRDYVKLPEAAPPPPAPTPATDAAPTLTPTPQPAGTRVEPPPAPAPDAQVKPMGIAEPAERIGVVIPLGSEQGPWRYALALPVNDVYYPVAYLDPGYAELPKLLWKRVLITGQHQWLEGWPRPRLTIASARVLDDAP